MRKKHLETANAALQDMVDWQQQALDAAADARREKTAELNAQVRAMQGLAHYAQTGDAERAMEIVGARS